MKHNSIAFLFPGQGAQTVGMGRDFYDAFTEVKELFEEAETVLKTHLRKIIFEGPEELLKETKNSQTAIFLTSFAILKVLEKQFPSLKPSKVAGLSLGEYTALTAARKMDFAQALSLVHYRGGCMHEACESIPGAMAAVMGFSLPQAREVAAAFPQELWVANVNSPEQIVLSGTLSGVEKGSALAKERGAKRVIALKVHGAFHSGLMKGAEEKLKQKLQEIIIHKSDIPVVMNVTGNVCSDEDIVPLLEKQVTHSVLWADTITHMKADLYLEVGPGKTLAGLNKQNGVMAPTYSINKIEDLDLLATLI